MFCTFSFSQSHVNIGTHYQVGLGINANLPKEGIKGVTELGMVIIVAWVIH
jgi:hypothetical protein